MFHFLSIAIGLFALPVFGAMPTTTVPSFAELEAVGARIGAIQVSPSNIFDLSDPREDRALFRLANALHPVTRPEVIRRALLFSTGDFVSVRRIEETERLLRRSRYLYDVLILPTAYRDGVVDLEIRTRDAWSIDLGPSIGRTGGANRNAIRVRDDNLLGMGISLGVARSNVADRTATEYLLRADRLSGTWFAFDWIRRDAADGQYQHISLVRPFHEMDARWSAGVSVTVDDRIEVTGRMGQVPSRVKRLGRRVEAFAGASEGLAGVWAQRYSVGWLQVQDTYRLEPSRIAAAEWPHDRALNVPFVRYELVEDRVEREVNRNLMGRPEFFDLGLRARIQVGRSTNGSAGLPRPPWMYDVSMSRGFLPGDDRLWLAHVGLNGEYSDDVTLRQRLSVQAHFYRPWTRRWLSYFSLGFDQAWGPETTGPLELGGEDGLRGYPLGTQAGSRRAIVTFEQRFFTDLYVWQLFRVGGATFFDAGRVWGGLENQTARSPWLRNVGAGLRIISVRAAFGNVLHIDMALPLHAPEGLRKPQLLITTKSTF